MFRLAIPKPAATEAAVLTEGQAEICAVVAAVAVAATLAVAPSGGHPLLAQAAIGLVTLWFMWRDARDFVIPDGASLSLAVLALGARLSADGLSLETAGLALGAGLACGGALWAVREAFYRLRGHDGLGFGDVKLAAACGVLVGVSGFALALLAACLAGIAVALLRRGAVRADRLPLGALLAPAAYAVWALGLGSALGSF